MLDRKTKDVDASVELMQDRKKLSWLVFCLFFIIGWAVVVVSAVLAPYKYDEIGIGIGIAFLIFATWFFIDTTYYNTLIMIKKSNDNKDEK